MPRRKVTGGEGQLDQENKKGWSRRKKILLIDFIQANRCIWDNNAPGGTDPTHKAALVSDFALNILHMEPHLVETHIQTMKDTYTRTLRQIEGKSGDGRLSLTPAMQEFMERFDFYRSKVELRASKSNLKKSQIIGLVLLGIGILVEGMHKDYVSINDALTSPSILAIVVGIFIVVTAMCGIIGAIKENLILLKIFLAIIIIVFILQVVIGIIAFVYREETAQVARKQLQFGLEQYHENEDMKKGVDAVQRKFKCCGLMSAKDWEKNQEFACDMGGDMDCGLPVSCCKDESKGEKCGYQARKNYTTLAGLRANGFHTTGCAWYFLMWVENHLDIVGATALGLAIPQILGIFLVYTFITKVEDRRYLFNYRKRFYPNE